MNSERLLDDTDNSVSLFRSAFQSLFGHLQERGIHPMDVSREEFLSQAIVEKETREWCFQNDGIAENDLSNYEEVMLDYLSSLRDCLRDERSSVPVISCLRMLFY